MLKAIHPAMSHDVPKAPAQMGHGDEVVLADTHFPGHLDPAVEEKCLAATRATCLKSPVPGRIDRFTFHNLARNADAVVMMHETAKYRHVLLNNGVSGDQTALTGMVFNFPNTEPRLRETGLSQN